jgi:hypothetical protein
MTDGDSLQGRIDQLIELDESRRNALDQMARTKRRSKEHLIIRQGKEFRRW